MLANYSREDEYNGDSYRFLAFLSIFHKFEMFNIIGENKLQSNTLNWAEFSIFLI